MAVSSVDEGASESALESSTSVQNHLDPGVWKELQQARNAAEFSQAWLKIQMALTLGVSRAMVVARQGDDYAVVACQPPEANAAPELIEAAERAIRERKGVVKNVETPAGEPPLRVLAYPVLVDDEVVSVPVLELRGQPESRMVAILRQLQWGASQFESFHLRRAPQLAGESSQRLSTALSLLTAALEEEEIQQSAFAVATELSSILGCERVSIGFLKRSNIRLIALSNSSSFDKKTNIMRAIGDAMDEAMDQRTVLTYPPADSEVIHVTVAQQAVLHESGAASICTLPLSKDGEIIGGITLEHSQPDFFDEQTVAVCEQVAVVLGPLLELQRLESRPIYRKGWDSFKGLLARLLGRGHFTLKLWALGLTSIIVFFSVVTTDYQIRAESTLEGYRQRHLAAPIDGYISSSEARPGDIVEAGQLLFKLDNKDLLLEKEKWANQSQQIEKQYRDAMQRREKDKVGIFRSQLNQANAQLALVDEQLSRTTALAPFDGVVISGDLSQRLGSPVSKGETLMQIAPLDEYRVILLVDERDIAQVREQAPGELVLSANPDQPLPFIVEKISPVSVAEEGVNRFRVEARIQTEVGSLRPGMQGNGKVMVGERKLIWVWTHRLTEWLKVVAWNWLP